MPSVGEGASKYLIPEMLLNDPKYVRPHVQHGYGLDAQWCDDFHHALHAVLTGERVGYYQDFGQLEHLAQTYRQGYHWVGQHCAYRKRRHGRPPAGLRADQLIVYAQNHDQVGNRKMGERFSSLLPFEALKLVAAAVLLSPNIPLLFMGEEYGETNPFPFFISHGDPHLVEAVREGRRREFQAFQWTGNLPDPQDEATFLRSKLNWRARDSGQHRVLLELHRELIRLRKTNKVLRHLSFDGIEAHADETRQVLHLRRRHENESVHAVFHFGAEHVAIDNPLPVGVWHKLMDTAEPRWHGPGSSIGDVASGTWRLAPYQVVVFTDRAEPVCA